MVQQDEMITRGEGERQVPGGGGVRGCLARFSHRVARQSA